MHRIYTMIYDDNNDDVKYRIYNIYLDILGNSWENSELIAKKYFDIICSIRIVYECGCKNE